MIDGLDIDTAESLWDMLAPIGRVRNALGPFLNPFYITEPGSLRARGTSSRLIWNLSHSVRAFATARRLREWSVEMASVDGLHLEFGVADATSTNQIARMLKSRGVRSMLYGFDSFQGLPEFWRRGVGAGAFKQARIPKVNANVELRVGLFKDTLPEFLREHPGPVSYIHVDCDLYSSTKFVLDQLDHAGRLVAGTVILFDELLNYPGWSQNGEYRALVETLGPPFARYRYLGIAPMWHQAAIIIDGRTIEQTMKPVR